MARPFLFPFRRLLRLAGSRWKYSTPRPHGLLKRLSFSLYNPSARTPQKTPSSVIKDPCVLVRYLAMDILLFSRAGVLREYFIQTVTWQWVYTSQYFVLNRTSNRSERNKKFSTRAQFVTLLVSNRYVTSCHAHCSLSLVTCAVASLVLPFK
jgi:hypothetical protein